MLKHDKNSRKRIIVSMIKSKPYTVMQYKEIFQILGQRFGNGVIFRTNSKKTGQTKFTP